MSHRFYRVCLILVTFALLSMIAIPAVWAQGKPAEVDVTIEEVDTSGLPTVQFRVSVVDANGVPVPGLDASAFALTEDGQPVQIKSAEPVSNPDVKIAVALAIDVSGSMAGALDEAKSAAKTFVNGLGPKDLVAIVAFGGELGSVNLGAPFPQIDPAREIGFTADKTRVVALIDSLAIAQPRTPLYDGLFKAIRMSSLVTEADYRFVLAFTDGNEKASADRGSNLQADDPIDEATNTHIPVFTIGLGDKADETYLRRVALRTGGDYQFAPTPDRLVAIYQTVADQAKLRYSISYEAKAPVDGKAHALTLTATTPKGQGSSSTPVDYICTTKPKVVLFYVDQSGTAQPLLSGQSAEGQLRIVPRVSGCSPTAQVELLLDGQSVGKAEKTPFELIYDFATLRSTAPGPHQLTIRAWDLAGGLSDDVSVDITVPPAPPSIATPGAPPTAISSATPSVGPIGGSTLPPWVPMLLAILLVSAAAVLAVLLIVRKPKRVCPNCGEVMDPSWDRCLHCENRNTQVGPAGATGSGAGTAVAFEDRTEPDMPLPVTTSQGGRSRAGRQIREDYEPVPQDRTVAMRRQPRCLGWLIVEQGDHPGKEHRLQEGDTNIGRAGTNQIILAHATVSREHARVRLEPEGFVVRDLAAVNPTLVNGQPITRHVLKEGDRLQVGDVVLVYKEVRA